jgi:fumarate reductase subunit C
MSARADTRRWLVQRLSAMILAISVIVHLGVIIMATRNGVSAAEIVERIQGNYAWMVFYIVFVVAAALHAPIGLRMVIRETMGMQGKFPGFISSSIGLILLVMGVQAVLRLYGLGA